jgi:hypothetical protein
MSDIDLDSPDLTALALGEADGERLDRALEFLIRSEEARAMAAETLRLGEQLSDAFGAEPGGRLSEAERGQLVRAARRQLWARRLKRAGLTTAICGLTAAVTLAGAAVLPPSGRAAESHAAGVKSDGATPAVNETATSVAESGGLELGLPAASTGDGGGVYRLSLSADAVQAAARENWKFAFGPSGEATFGPAVAENTPGAASPPPATTIDQLVTERLQHAKIEPSREADDATVLRRLYLDVTGTPPTQEEIAVFENDPAPDKLGPKVTELMIARESVEPPVGPLSRAYARAYGGRGGMGGGGIPAEWAGAGAYPASGLSGDPGFQAGGRSGYPGSPASFGGGPTTSPVTIYPPEVQAVVEELKGQEDRIRREVESRVRSERVAVLGRLRQLLDEYTRSGRLDEALAVRSVVWKLEAETFDVRPDPGRLTPFRGTAAGTSYVFRVTGNPNAGIVWGSGIYTDDSALAAAAVHAGVLRPGEKGLVRVTILPGQSSYAESSQNGVTSNPYSAWEGSYRVEQFEPNATDQTATSSSSVLDAPASLTEYRDRVGQAFTFRVTGDPNAGTVWGRDIYTDDSPLAAAAVHAGVLKAGETGPVKVTILPGQGSYSASDRNGVTTSDYHEWVGSYRVEPVSQPVSSTGAALDRNAERASCGGKYRRLLMTIDARDDRQTYGEFKDFGFWGDRTLGRHSRLSYRGHDNLPEAYWVYVAPTWYLWAESSQAQRSAGEPGPAAPAFGSPAGPIPLPDLAPGSAGPPEGASGVEIDFLREVQDAAGAAPDVAPAGAPPGGGPTSNAGAPREPAGTAIPPAVEK